jgi:translation initiation factor IF-2
VSPRPVQTSPRPMPGQGQGSPRPGQGPGQVVGSPRPGVQTSPSLSARPSPIAQGQGGQGGVGARPRPDSGGKQFAGSNRYSLSDPGASAGAGGGPPPQSLPPPSFGQGPGGQGGGGQGQGGPGRYGKGTGPTTFAEMGIQGAKAEDKECRIM